MTKNMLYKFSVCPLGDNIWSVGAGAGCGIHVWPGCQCRRLGVAPVCGGQTALLPTRGPTALVRRISREFLPKILFQFRHVVNILQDGRRNDIEANVTSAVLHEKFNLKILKTVLKFRYIKEKQTGNKSINNQQFSLIETN